MGDGKDAATVVLAGPTRDQSVRTPKRSSRPAIELVRGTFVGRYVIVDELGEGGMGVVYAAYDPELDRKVALKVLRPERAAQDDASARLVAEARALAKLSHPNVVSIFDVQTVDGQVVLAMEFVDGQTVDEWLTREPRTWREILAVFAAAGRGLAGAHAAQFVHRDFKPNNVMIAHDAPHAVRVLDFGLAQTASLTTDDQEVETLATSGEGTSDSGHHGDSGRLTHTGFAVGTPRYMSPEQRRGRRVDARSDQFSFCVALWESLFGEPPHAGTSRSEVARAAARGVLREPKRGRAPAFVVRALRRGLQPDPDARFASMEALLAALRRDPSKRRRQVALASVGGVFVLGAGVGLGRIDAPPSSP
ncbi:MAG: serine/threonine-protein kinase, partial [Myxococcota bacterium]